MQGVQHGLGVLKILGLLAVWFIYVGVSESEGYLIVIILLFRVLYVPLLLCQSWVFAKSLRKGFEGSSPGVADGISG